MKDGVYVHKWFNYIAIKDSELFGIKVTLTHPSIIDDLTLTALRKEWVWIGEF